MRLGKACSCRVFADFADEGTRETLGADLAVNGREEMTGELIGAVKRLLRLGEASPRWPGPKPLH